MATRLYFHAASSGLSNLPTARNSDAPGTLADVADAVTVNRSMDRTIGAIWTGFNKLSVAFTSVQEYYWTRFVSPPLTAQTISAQTWTTLLSFYQSSNNANFPRASTGAIYLCVYLWRPGTGLVGYFINGNGNADAQEPTTNSVYKACITTFSGASQTAQLNDVIIFEWVTSTAQAASASYGIRVSYDGTEVLTSNQDTPVAPGNIACYLQVPQDLVFTTDPPAYLDMTEVASADKVLNFITKA